MSSINFRLYGDQIYGLACSKIKDFITPDLEKELFTSMFKEGQIKYDNIQNKQKISVNPQITINNLEIKKLFLNIPNETENFSMNLSGIKATIELFEINEKDIENIINQKRKTLIEEFISYAVKKIEQKESSKSFIEGLIENLINRAINGLKIEINNVELKIVYKNNNIVFFIEKILYSEESGAHVKNFEFFYENGENLEKKYNVIKKFNIEIEIKKAENESEYNELNLKLSDFQFELSKTIISAFNEIFNLIDNTKYKYLYIRNKKLIHYYRPKKPENSEKKEYYNLLWLYSIKTVIKLQKYIGNNKLYLLDLPDFIQEKITKKYLDNDNNNEIEKLILPTEINLLKATKEKVEKKVLDGKKGNVLTNAFSFFFGGKKDDEEEKKELSEEEKNIFENIYTDNYLINYLYGKNKDKSNQNNPIKDKIIGFIRKLKININFNKLELILANDDINKFSLYINNIKLNLEKINNEINSILTIGNIGSNLNESLFSERIKLNDNNDLIMISKDKNNKTKIDLGFKNIELGEDIFNFMIIFFSSIKINKKNKIFKQIKYEIKNEEDKKEEIKNTEEDKFEEKKIEFNNNEIFKNISISSIPSLVISNDENKTFFKIVNYSITPSKVEITYDIKDSFGTILHNYTFIFNKDEKINKYSLNLETPLRIILSRESSKLLFISFLKIKERINQIKIRNEKINKKKIINNSNNNNDEEEKELFRFNFVIHKNLDMKDYNLNDLQIVVLMEKIIIEIYENEVKSKFSIHNLNLTYENKNITLKIEKISINTNLMSTMIIYLADFESPNFKEFQKYIDSIKNEYKDNYDYVKNEKEEQNIVKKDNKNEGNIKYDINIDNILNSIKIFINSLIFSLQSGDNIISYSFNKIRIQKKDESISVKLSGANLSFRKEGQNFKNIKIINLEEETGVNFDPKKNLALIRLTHPKINMDLETINNIQKSMQYLLEQVDWEIILCKVDLQILNSILKLNNLFNISISELLVKNFDEKKNDTIYLTLKDFEIKNKNNEFITGQKALNINLIIKSIIDYSLIVNFSDLNINLSKKDIINLSTIFMDNKENSLNENIIIKEEKHFKPHPSQQKDSHEFNVYLEGNIPLMNFILCSDDKNRSKKCELILSPIKAKTKIFIPANFNNSNDIQRKMNASLGKINLIYNIDENDEYNIIEYKGKEDLNFNFDEKSMISFETNVETNRNQIEIKLNNEKNKDINDIRMDINMLGINLRLDILLNLLIYIKDIIPKNLLDKKIKNNINKEDLKDNKRISEIKFNINFNEIGIKFESKYNNSEEIYLNINKINYNFSSVKERKLPLGYNEIKMDKLYLIIINNEEKNKIINTQNNFMNINADIKDNLSEININMEEMFINLCFTDFVSIKSIISSNASYINKNKNNLLICNNNNEEIKNKSFSLNYNMKLLDLTLIDNYSNNYQPFLNLKLDNLSSFLNEKKILNSSLYISLSTYNYISSVWEPIIEKSCIKSMILQKKENNSITNIIKVEIYQILINISDMLIGSIVLSMNNLKKILDSNKPISPNNEVNVSRSRVSFSISSILSNSNTSFKDIDFISQKRQTNNKIINLTGKDLKIQFNNKKYNCGGNSETELEYINKFDKDKNIMKIFYDNNIIDIPFNILGIDCYKLNDKQFLVWENIVSKDRQINVILYSQIIFKNKTNNTFQIKIMNKKLGNKFILLRSNSKSGIPIEYCNTNTTFAIRVYEKELDKNYFNQNNNIFNISDIINIPNDKTYQKKINLQNKSLLLKLQNKINNVSTLLITSEYFIINCLPCDILLHTKNKKEKIRKCTQFPIDFSSDSELEIQLIIKTNTDYFISEIFKLYMLVNNYEKDGKNAILFRSKKGESFNLSFLLKNKDYNKSLIIYSEYILFNDSGINFKFESNLIFNIAENIYLISNKINLEKSNFELLSSDFNPVNINLQEVIKASPFYNLRLNKDKDYLNFSIKKNLSFISIRNNPNFRENIISMVFNILPICKIINLLPNKILLLGENNDKNDKTKKVMVPPLNQISFNFFNKNKINSELQLGLININENECKESCLFNSFHYGIYTFFLKQNFFNLEIKDSSSDGVLNIFATETNFENAKIIVINKTNEKFQIYQNNYEHYKQIIKENDTQILKIYNQNYTAFIAEICGKKFGLNFIAFKEEFSIFPVNNEYILVKESNGVKMKIILYTKNEFEKLNEDENNLYGNIIINNCYISLIGDNFNKDKKLRNYRRNEIILVYLQNFDTELNINKYKDITHKKDIALKLNLSKMEIFNQLSKTGNYSCIFKNINAPCMNINIKIDLYSDDQVAKINDFNYYMNKLKLNIDPEFILEIINFAENVVYRLGKINFNVDKIFLRTNKNIRDIKIKKNIEKYKINQKLICYGVDFNFPSINIDYELTEINLEKLLRDKVGCTSLFVWLGFGLVHQKQNIYFEKFKINQYFGDLVGLILRVQNNYKSQMSSIIFYMGLHVLFGQIKQIFNKEKIDENSIDVQKNRIRYPRAFYGKYNYIKNYNEEEAKIIDNLILKYQNDFKEIFCNDLFQSNNYIFYLSGLSLFIFTKKYELYYKIDYNNIENVLNEEENLIIKYKNENGEENPPSVINCDKAHFAKRIMEFLYKYKDKKI